MIFEICAILAVFIFAILAIYIICTLVAVQKTLRQHSALIGHFNDKLRKLDSTFQTISNLGDISEEKTLQLREHIQHPKTYIPEQNDYTDDLAILLLATLKLGSKFLKRK